MEFAVNKDGIRVHAFNAKKGESYKCPICKGDVILRKGDININHFAHKSNECVDNWNYDMSEWHYSMQQIFPEEQREIVVKYNGQTHRADVLKGKQIIEFQHSPITSEEIIERNNFYNSAGYSVAWVFDVQEQYDKNAITLCDNDKAEMYIWSNPKRFLQVFPIPKESNKNLIIYLYWMQEDGNEWFNRVIWSTHDCDIPNFKKFIVSDYSIGLDDECLLSVEDFFMTKHDMLKERLSEISCKYEVKYSGVKGHKRNDDYVCPRTNNFGIKRCGEKGCSYCKYCAAIKELQNGFQSYCCYPNQVNEVTEGHPGYECSGTPVY